MNTRDRESERGKERTDEERRFLLWSIARANPKRISGPYLSCGRPESLESPNINRDARQRDCVSKPRKGNRYYHRMLLSKSAKIAGTSGLVIGFNFGLLATLASTAMVDKVISIAVPTVLCGLIGLTLGWVCVLNKRTDLFSYRFPF